MLELSKSKIDRLGQALKLTPVTEETLRELDDFRLSFEEAISHVVKVLREKLGVECTQRPSKSTPSIIAKLNRQSARLSQIQDIAGLRIIVKDFSEQDSLRDKILALFDANHPKVFDRRIKPIAGYRAVHVVVEVENRLVEIQVRTELQHLWGQLSEAYADKYGHDIKYKTLDMDAYEKDIQLKTEEDSSKVQNRILFALQLMSNILQSFHEASVGYDDSALVETSTRRMIETLNSMILDLSNQK